MRILITSYYPPNKGGAEVSTYLIAKKLKEMGNDVVIASTGDYKGIKTYRLRKYRLWPFSFQHQYLKTFISKIVKKEKIDIIHPQERLTTIGSILAAKENNIPVIVHFRDYWFACPESTSLMPTFRECEICSYKRIFKCFKNRIPWNIYKWYVIKSNWKLLNEADKKIAISSAVKRKLNICGIKDVLIIPNPIDLKIFKSDKERVEKIKEEYNLQPPVILYVGALMYHKGILNLLKVFAEDEILRRTDFLIVGDGNLRKACEEFVKRENLKYVKFIGKVSFKDIPNFYAVSDIVVFPSIWQEPFGRVVLEAMAAGKPIVASNVGGIPDLLTHKNGFLVEPFNNKMWAKYLNILISDKELREKMGKIGKNLSKKFDVEVIAKKIISLYRETIKD